GIVAKDFALRLTSQNEINSKLWDSLNDHFPRATLLGITDGIRGSWIQEEKGAIFHQPAYLINSVLDTTGCGDAYHGAFLSGILKNMTTQECAKTASAAGALNSIKIGGRGNLCDANEIETFLKSAQEI
ncbi:MAG: PfkB family carbohydrate kinase, partial [Verrucomicrobiota bacterium]|nr:PfkB family carbohydrate kinase [Verrucomicrobiota bacterium]